jgi:hypothetical protein
MLNAAEDGAVITLEAGTYMMDCEVEVVGKDITIIGDGRGNDGTILDANWENRHFFVKNGHLTLQSVALVHGMANTNIPNMGGSRQDQSWQHGQWWALNQFSASEVAAPWPSHVADSGEQAGQADYYMFAPYEGGAILAGTAGDVTATDVRFQQNRGEESHVIIGAHIAMIADYPTMAGTVTLEDCELRNDHTDDCTFGEFDWQARNSNNKPKLTSNLGGPAIKVASAGELIMNNVDISRSTLMGEGPSGGEGSNEGARLLPYMEYDGDNTRGTNGQFGGKAVSLLMPRNVQISNSKFHRMQCDSGCFDWKNVGGYGTTGSHAFWKNEFLARSVQHVADTMPDAKTNINITNTEFTLLRGTHGTGINIPAGSGHASSWGNTWAKKGQTSDGESWGIKMNVEDCLFHKNWAATRTAQLLMNECYKPSCTATIRNVEIKDSYNWYTDGQVLDTDGNVVKESYHCMGGGSGCNCEAYGWGQVGGPVGRNDCTDGWVEGEKLCKIWAYWCFDEKNDDGSCSAPNGQCQSQTKEQRKCYHNPQVQDGATNNWRQVVGTPVKFLPCNSNYKDNVWKSAGYLGNGVDLFDVTLGSEMDGLTMHGRKTTSGDQTLYANGPLTISECRGRTECFEADGAACVEQADDDRRCTVTGHDSSRPEKVIEYDSTGMTYFAQSSASEDRGAWWLANLRPEKLLPH